VNNFFLKKIFKNSDGFPDNLRRISDGFPTEFDGFRRKPTDFHRKIRWQI